MVIRERQISRNETSSSFPTAQPTNVLNQVQINTLLITLFVISTLIAFLFAMMYVDYVNRPRPSDVTSLESSGTCFGRGHGGIELYEPPLKLRRNDSRYYHGEDGDSRESKLYTIEE
jgi:hypothetical protein